jgi:hypothetical protein
MCLVAFKGPWFVHNGFLLSTARQRNYLNLVYITKNLLALCYPYFHNLYTETSHKVKYCLAQTEVATVWSQLIF